MNLIKRFKNISPIYFVCIGLVTALCYGFTLTNHSMGIDDEAFIGYFTNHSFLSQGRWGYLFIKKIFNYYEFIPFWRDFIAVLSIILGLTLFNVIFKRFSNGVWDDKLFIIFSCLALSFPYIATSFIFMMTTIETGLILILSALSVYFSALWIIEKQHWLNCIYSISILTFSIALGETTPIIFLMSFFMVLFLWILSTKKISFMNFFISIIKVCIILLLSIVLWKIIGIFLQNLLHVNDSGYVNNYIYYDFKTIGGFLKSLKSFLKNFLILFLRNFQGDFGSIIVSTMTISLLISCIIFAIKEKKILIFFCGACILISANALSFITGNAFLPHRTLNVLMILISFSFSLIYLLFKNVNIKNIKLKYIVLFFAALIVFYQSKQMNEYFFVDYKSYQYDISLMTQIDHDIKANSDNNKIIFVGMPKEFNQVIEPTVGNSLFNWDRECLLELELASSRLYPFFQQHGYDIFPPASYKKELLKSQIKNMSVWPKPGSIKECDEYVIVKLGDSFLEKVVDMQR